MSKRTRAGDEGGSAVKRARRAAAGAAPPSLDQVRLCQEVFESLKYQKSEDGRLLCEPFFKAPSRRNNPEYYKTITNPIDMARIQQKIKTEEYESIELLAADVLLMVENAKTYHKRNSQEYRDACDVWEAFVEKKMKALDGDKDNQSETNTRSRDTSPSPSNRSLRSDSPTRSTRSKEASPGRLAAAGADPVDPSLLQELLVSVMELTDESGRLISPPFRLLPSKDEYGEYYEAVKDPIDLKMIAYKIKSGAYRSFNDIERDLNLLCKNAKVFNEPGSMIHRDSTALRKFVTQRKTELLERAVRPMEKDRAEHNLEVTTELLSQTVAEEETNELSEDSEEDEETEKSNDPLWRLYWTVRNYAHPNDPQVMLAEAFCLLPNRNWYPDYYDEIKDPMSFYLINKKLKRRDYGHLRELVSDLNLVFQNAKSYNIEGSEIFDNACRLQVMANQKAKEFDPTIDISLYQQDLIEQERMSTPLGVGLTPQGGKTPKSRAGADGVKGRPGRKTLEELMSRYRAKMLLVWDAIVDHRDPSGRWIAQQFMELPSPKFYPDYYQVIPEPIDLKTIKRNIEIDKYNSSSELAADVCLLFNNARHYNEPNSLIYTDSMALENIFRNALKGLGPVGIESPAFLKEKFGWSKTRAPGPHKSSSVSSGLSKVGNPGTPNAQGERQTPKRSNPGGSNLSPEQMHMWILYSAIKDYTDPRGRKLSAAFLRLPARNEYPDYYDVIRRPMDLQKIANRLGSGQYESLDALAQDFVLMFDNACRYNEPESVIYKDALSLQKVLIQKKAEIGHDRGDGAVPDVQACVQALLNNLFITVHNQQDDEGRCYSDSLFEVADRLKQAGITEPPLTLDRIKRNLAKGRYQRLDRFQEDMFEVFDKACSVSRSDSQLFEDAVELKMCYIKTRDELCRVQHGEWLLSPASLYTERIALASIDQLKKEKQKLEQREDALRPFDPKMSPSKIQECEVNMDSITIGDIEYTVGDFAYVQAPDDDPNQNERHLMRIDRIWHDEEEDLDFVSANWFYKPHQTYHLATRKFLKKEVFKSAFYDNVVASRLLGKCYVMFIRDYFKYKPKGFDENDVYVCESRYLGRQLHFKKMKQWPYDDDGVDLDDRDEPLAPVRFPSVFVSAQNKEQMVLDEPKPMLDQQDADVDDCSVLEKPKQEVELDSSEGITYYEQLSYNRIWLKLGEAVYVSRPEKEQPDIVRIDKLWRTADGDGYLSGPWFARPIDIEHEPTRMFLKRELFGTEQPDTIVPLASVISRCVVLPLKEFSSMRPTEFLGRDVFVCQFRVLGRGAQTPGLVCSITSSASSADLLQNQNQEQDATDGDSMQSPPPSGGAPMSESSARRLKQLKSYKLSDKVLEDEIFYFKKAINPEKEASPLLMKTDTTVDADALSMVDFNESSSEVDASETSSIKDMANWLATQPKLNSRSKSGYILFSAEIRKRIMHENPNSTFGEISKMVGVEWKKLTEDDKKQYEVRASIIAEERERADALMGPPAGQRPQPGQTVVFCCKWQGCDYQFENSDLLYEHITTAHTSQIVEVGENQFVCLWQSCAKYRKDGKPFPSLPRLHRHIKEKHMANTAKCVFPNQRSKHYVGVNPPVQQMQQQQYAVTPQQQMRQPYTQTPQQQFVQVDAHGQIIGQQQQQLIATPIYQVHPGQQSIQPVVQSQQQSVTVQQPASQQQTGDPGKRVVAAPKPAEPVFVAPPDSQRVNRVLHSEVYLRYIDSMYGDKPQPSVSKWDRALGARQLNTPAPLNRQSGADWLPLRPGTNEEEVTRALWNLRERMLKESLGIERLVSASSGPW